jgi:hypothetical protein
VVVLDWGNHRAMLLSREGDQLGAFGGGRYAHPARIAGGGGEPATGSGSPASEAGADVPAAAVSAAGLEAPPDASGSVAPASADGPTAPARPGAAAAPGASDAPGAPAEVATAGGTFIVQFVPGPGELPLNELFEISVRVLEGAGREPVSAGVELAVDAEMPAHRHGMTTRTRVRREPDGSFSVRGLLLHMPGAWRLTFDVTRGGVTERAEVEVVLE